MSDPMAERVRKIGGTTLRSASHISRLQTISDNNEDYVEPLDMLAELREDNKTLVRCLREAHGLCDHYDDVATASLIENWVDETERRVWFCLRVAASARPGIDERLADSSKTIPATD